MQEAYIVLPTGRDISELDAWKELYIDLKDLNNMIASRKKVVAMAPIGNMGSLLVILEE